MARRLLTRKRARWAANRTVTFRGNVLRSNISVENRYAVALMRLADAMTAQVARDVLALYRTDTARQRYATDANLGSQARILLNKLENQFFKTFNANAKHIADRMVRGADKQSKATLHSSLQRLSGGLSLSTGAITADMRDMLTATVAENVGLIKTIPQEYFGQVRGAVMRSITEPDTDGLAGVVRKVEGLLNERARQIRNKARNLALDQTRKTYNNFNKGRMEAVGIEEFEWVHSGGGQRPRELHQQRLNGNIYSFNDLPVIDERTGERGIPGQAINCRCTMRPVLRLDNGEVV